MVRGDRLFAGLSFRRYSGLGLGSRPCTSNTVSWHEDNGPTSIVPFPVRLVKNVRYKVTSSCLCKKPEGAVFPFGLLVHSVEDGIDNPIHASDVDEADHGPRAASHLDEATLDDVGGAELRPKLTGEVKEGQQLGQVLLQALHHGRIRVSPVRAKDPESGLRCLATLGEVDVLRFGVH